MSGSCSASWLRAARSEPCSSGRTAKTTASSAGRGKRGLASRTRRRLADGVADPDRAEAADRRHLAGREDVAARRPGRGEHPDRRRLRLLPSPDPHALAGAEGAGEQAHVGDALAGRGPLDLEDAARDRSVRVTGRARKQLIDAGEQRVDPGASGRGPEEDRMDDATPRLDRELLAKALEWERRLVADVGAEDRLVVFGEGLGQGGQRGRDRPAVNGTNVAAAAAGITDRAHRHDARRQSPPELPDDPLRIGTGPVDLVDEDQRRDVEPLERAEQEWRLRLDALDRRDDEDRAVQDAEDALDLGDEVRVAGRVDQVDREVAHEERGDRGPDRDAAFALELERVGLGGAGVDAADVVDRAGGVEESLAEGGLTGVDVGEDSEIERAHGTSCRARRY